MAVAILLVDSYGGGTYTNCANPSAPGVASVVSYLKSVNVKPNCQEGHYYLLNNYNPGYLGDGSNAYAEINNPPKYRVHDSAVECQEHRR